MSLLDWLTPPEELNPSWPEVRAEATLLARERVARYELERAARMAEYARTWPSAPERQRKPVLAWSREVAR